MIHVLGKPATSEQIEEMLQTLGVYVKLAIDVRLGILAGGGPMHADCEGVLLSEGCRQADIWGADWDPLTRQITFESLINIRPRQNNPSLEVLDVKLRERMTQIAQSIFGAE